MKRIALVLALSLAAAARLHASPPPIAEAPSKAAATSAASSTAGPAAKAKPENGAWGVDLANMDTSIRPGDDFSGYVNGQWLRRTEIPADKLEVGGLNSLQDKALEQTKALLGLGGLMASRLGQLWIAFDVFSHFTVQFGIVAVAFAAGRVMPRARRSTSRTASSSLAYGHMRQPPSAGPRLEL